MSDMFKDNFLVELPDSVSIAFVREVILKFQQDLENLPEQEENEEEGNAPEMDMENEEEDGDCKEKEPLFNLVGSCLEVSKQISANKSVAIFYKIADEIYKDRGISEEKKKEICAYVRCIKYLKQV